MANFHLEGGANRSASRHGTETSDVDLEFLRYGVLTAAFFVLLLCWQHFQ